MTELGPETSADRTYVIDTNVLLYDPRSLFVFHEHDVVIPITVIEEVDKFKKDLNETGRNARQISRNLDELRGKGSLSKGVPLPGGGRIFVDHTSNDSSIAITWGAENNDNRILRTCVRLDAQSPGKIVLVTRDTNMRLKCDALGVAAEDYEHAHIDIDEQYTGWVERTVPPAWIDDFYQSGEGRLDPELFVGLHAQQFVLLTAEGNPSKTALGRIDIRKERVRMVGRHKEGVWGIFARNKEQLFALDLLLDDSLSLVTLNGVAGTGKTLMAIAAGLKKVADERIYTKMLVSRPIFPMGRDMGFLPGDIEQKLNPWMKPIYDSLEFLMSTQLDGRGGRQSSAEPQYQQLLDQRMIEVEPLTYIRGRSIPRQLLIVDEAQNLTPHEVKTVLTRAGEGTKVVLTGDPNQIDNPYVDALSNGLTYTVERFKDAAIAGHVTLRKGERSELAELAAELL
ncbi:MAG: PhoH family protein [Proteobacteria bacterium]|nr:PhoH family protein [Pseudomonadota bacterium]